VEFDVFHQKDVFIYDEHDPKKMKKQDHIIVQGITDFAEQLLAVCPPSGPEPAVPEIFFQLETTYCAMITKAIQTSNAIPNEPPFNNAEGLWQCVAEQEVNFAINAHVPWTLWRSNQTAYLAFKDTDVTSQTFPSFFAQVTGVPVRVDNSNLFVLGHAANAISNEWPRLMAAVDSAVRNGVKDLYVTLAQAFLLHALKTKEQLTNSLNIQAITFAAPMILAVIGDHLDHDTQKLVDDVAANCVNLIVNNDWLPYLPRLAADIPSLEQIKHIAPTFLTNRDHYTHMTSVAEVASHLSFAQHYRSAAGRTIAMLWAEDKEYPQATNRPWPYTCPLRN